MSEEDPRTIEELNVLLSELAQNAVASSSPDAVNNEEVIHFSNLK